MNIWHSAKHGLIALFRRQKAERELTDEVQHYFDQAVREQTARGVSAADALRNVQMEIGSDTFVREEVRTYGWEHRVDTLLADLRYAFRRLKNNVGFTTVAVLSLALGIGANTAIFSLVNATLLKRLPVEHPEELAYVIGGSGAMSYPDFSEIRANGTVFTALAAWGGITGSLGVGEESNLVVGAIVTGNYFSVLGVKAALGRVITENDDRTPGAHPVAVISHHLWQTRFGGRSDVVGSAMRYNGQSFTVIGVMPPAFQGAVQGESRDIYVPMMMQAVARPPRARYSGEMNPDLLNVRTNRWLFGIGRLRPNATAAQALAQLTAISKEQERLSPTNNQRVPTGTVTMVNDGLSDRSQLISVSQLLLLVVGAVLLIACVNVANLTLAQSSARRKEVAVRLALGASRGRLIRQLLTESVMLSALGGAIGWLVAWGAVRALRASPPPDGALPITLDFSMDTRVLLFTFTLAVLTGVLFGLVPALRASRPQLVPALKDQGSGANDRLRKFNGRNTLVVVQLALSLVLLVTAGLFLRSFRITESLQPGFDAERVAVSALRINILRYTREQGRRMYRDAVERVEAIPGVQSASVGRWAPLTGGNSIRGLLIQGRTGSDNVFRNEGGVARAAAENSVNVNTVGMRWFETMGVAVVSGRDFSARDDSGTTPVSIVNEAFVHKYLANESPLGKRISFGGADGPWLEIVGVVNNFKVNTLTENPEPLAFVPVMQNHETGMTLFVRSRTESVARITPNIRAEIQALERNLPLSSVNALSDLVNTSLYTARAGARVLLGFGIMALALASIGLYGVISYTVSRRTREIGVRMALGAQPVAMLRNVIGQAAGLALVGITAGILVAFGVTRLLTSFLYGVSTSDATTFAAIPLVLMFVAVAASILPARRAMKIDPIRALKSE